MSIQRWTMDVNYAPDGRPYPDAHPDPENGDIVTYDDHVAAVAEAQQEAAKVWEQMSYDTGYAKGRNDGYGQAMDDGWGEPGHIKAAVADALDAVREALELLPVSFVDTRFDPDDDRHYVQAVRLTTALAAIDGLKGESNG